MSVLPVYQCFVTLDRMTIWDATEFKSFFRDNCQFTMYPFERNKPNQLNYYRKQAWNGQTFDLTCVLRRRCSFGMLFMISNQNLPKMCLNIGAPKNNGFSIWNDFPFQTNGKSFIFGVPILLSM